MLVLGIDPGLATTGYALVESDNQRMTPIDYGVIRTPAHTPTAERLTQLYGALGEIISQHHPDEAAVEELFFASNVTTAMVVGQARGVILLALAQAHLPTLEYTPMQIKEAVTGYGGATKSQIQEMVRLLLNLGSIPRPDDAADALAVSICHHHSSHLKRLTQA